MGENLIDLGELLSSVGGTDTVSGDRATLTADQAEEMKQLAMLFAELEREFGESDDPDLRFAAAFARQCAMGNLGVMD
jgi:hypothetical protein